jgi:hypothetical protein
MGFRFRKTVRFGPVNINIGKSGVGYSVGRKGARVGKSSTGRSYTSFGIPGTGMSWRSEGKKAGQGCLFPVIFLVLIFTCCVGIGFL